MREVNRSHANPGGVSNTIQNQYTSLEYASRKFDDQKSGVGTIENRARTRQEFQKKSSGMDPLQSRRNKNASGVDNSYDAVMRSKLGM